MKTDKHAHYLQGGDKMENCIAKNRRKRRWAYVIFGISTLFLFCSCSKGVLVHPLVKEGEPRGYVEFFVVTGFGLFFKGLEEGEMTCGDWAVALSDPAGFVFEELIEKGYYDYTAIPSWGEDLSSMKYRSIADNFSYCRVGLPLGKNEIIVIPRCLSGKHRTQLKEDIINGKGNIVLNVPANRMILVRLDVRTNPSLKMSHYIATTTLPVPSRPELVDPDPNAVEDLIRLLDEQDWGFRWYAAKRLGLIGDKRAVYPLQQRLARERHADVRNELEKALNRQK
jgi:hypothetical protein